MEHCLLQVPASLALVHMLLSDQHCKDAMRAKPALCNMLSMISRHSSKQLRATCQPDSRGAARDVNDVHTLTDQYSAARSALETSALLHVRDATALAEAERGEGMVLHAQQVLDAVIQPATPAATDSAVPDTTAVLAAVAAVAAAPAAEADEANAGDSRSKRRKTGSQSDWHLTCPAAMLCAVVGEATGALAPLANNLSDTITFIASQQQDEAVGDEDAAGPSTRRSRSDKASQQLSELADGLAHLRSATGEALQAALAHMLDLALTVQSGDTQSATLVAAAELVMTAAQEALQTVSQGAALLARACRSLAWTAAAPSCTSCLSAMCADATLSRMAQCARPTFCLHSMDVTLWCRDPRRPEPPRHRCSVLGPWHHAPAGAGGYHSRGCAHPPAAADRKRGRSGAAACLHLLQ